MAGLLTHLGLGFLGFLIIYFAFYKSKRKVKLIYGGIFVLANIIPDLVDFGILSIKMGSLNPAVIITHELFHTLAVLGHTFSNWLVLALVIILLSLILYKIGKISKEGFVKVIVGVVLFLIGVVIHLGLDVLIMETSCWI